MFIEVFLFFVVIILYFIKDDWKPSNMPPGPWEIPFLGSHFPVYSQEKLDKLRIQYGDVVTVRFGISRTVLIYDPKLAKETLARPECVNRPEFWSTFSLDEQRKGGVALSNGEQWAHDRRFFIRTMRNLGMGKSYLEGAIHEEAQALVDDLIAYKGEPINYPRSFRTAALNIIWQLVASTRYDLRSDEVTAMYDAAKELYKEGELTFFVELIPILKKLPEFIKKPLFKTDLPKRYTETIGAIVIKTIDEHKKSFDPENPRDLIDEYLLEEEKANKTGDNEFLRRGALCQIVSDAFDAGSDTINNMLKWLVFSIVKFPEVAEKARCQIDQFVPRDRMVSLDDKPNLPFVEAYVTELFRYSSLVCVNVERVVKSDIKVGQYTIPKGSSVQAVNLAIHNDENIWDEPKSFKPERFVTDEGKFKAPDQGFIPFGSGRRVCAGETLARMEFFLFSAAILQQLEVSVAPGETLNDTITIDPMTLRLPFDNNLVYKKRTN